jgi:hypothetical protein
MGIFRNRESSDEPNEDEVEEVDESHTPTSTLGLAALVEAAVTMLKTMPPKGSGARATMVYIIGVVILVLQALLTLL